MSEVKKAGSRAGLDRAGVEHLWRAVRQAKAAEAVARKAMDEAGAPPWIEAARKCVGMVMKHHVTEQRRWDVCTIASVMRGHLPLFVERIGCGEFRAKELLESLLQTVEGRHRRAHAVDTRVSNYNDLAQDRPHLSKRETYAQQPTVSESLDAIRHMSGVLQQCGLNAEANDMQGVLAEAQGLVELARAAFAGPTPSHRNRARRSSNTTAAKQRLATLHDVSAGELEEVVLYRALYDFEEQLFYGAGKFAYRDATIIFPPTQRDRQWAPEDEYRVKEQSPGLRVVARARRWLFHDQDSMLAIEDALAAMEAVLEALDGLRTGTGVRRPASRDREPVIRGIDGDWLGRVETDGGKVWQLDTGATAKKSAENSEWTFGANEPRICF